jgi:hypothetical protein
MNLIPDNCSAEENILQIIIWLGLLGVFLFTSKLLLSLSKKEATHRYTSQKSRNLYAAAIFIPCLLLLVVIFAVLGFSFSPFCQ